MSAESHLFFKCAVITGGGGGIGKAIAEYFIAQGKKVLLAGRTESKLKATADEIGAAGYYVLDTGKVANIPGFVERVVADHPELDCIVNNAGVQRPLEIVKDDDFLSKADQEIDINIRGPMHLTLALLPHFKAKPAALIINVSSVLGFIPFSIINPVYNGTKAFLHFWSMNLRTQLEQARTKIKVVEIAPPTVATDLHRERENPDDNKKENNPSALTVDEFMKDVAKKLQRGDDTISAGMGEGIVDKWFEAFGPKYQESAAARPMYIPRHRSQSQQRADISRAYDDYTVAWVCALAIEMAAAQTVLDESHTSLPTRRDDSNTYALGRVGQHNVAIACLPTGGYGMNNAAIVASNMRRTFPSIRLALMVGKGGGVPGKTDVRLGDVVVGTKMIQYDLGKTSSSGLTVTSTPRIPPHEIMTAVATLQAQHELGLSDIDFILAEIRARWPDYADCTQLRDRLFESTYPHPDSSSTCDACDASKEVVHQPRRTAGPKIHYGLIACANQVMKDGETRDRLAKQFDVLCFEMEAAGVVDSLPTLSIRGICDYADSHKNKDWQRYAAGVAAAYAKEWLGVVTPMETREQRAAAIVDPRERLLRSLRFEQMDSRMQAVQRAQTRTCEWLFELETYKSWLDDTRIESHHGFLWLKGKPGTGKSTLMKHALSRVRESGKADALLSFFFHVRGHELEKSILGLHQSLLLQLVEALSDLRTVLDVKARQCEKDGYVLWTVDTLRDLFTAAVERLGRRRVVCFIDALDECETRQVRDMITYFEELQEMARVSAIPLFICFSSRHYPTIVVEHGLSLTLDDQDGHSRDLEAYVDRRLRIGKGPDAQDVRSKVLAKANGIFLWLVLVIDILNETYSDGALFWVHRRLEELPEGLGELFMAILSRDTRNSDQLLVALQCVLYAARPLSVDEYYAAIAVNLTPEVYDYKKWHFFEHNYMDVERFVTSSSRGLAEVIDSRERPYTVQFIHESVRDFCVGDMGLKRMWPNVSDMYSMGHERLKMYCQATVRYMSRTSSSHGECYLEQKTDGSNEDLCFKGGPNTWITRCYAEDCLLHHADQAARTIPQGDLLDELETTNNLEPAIDKSGSGNIFIMGSMARNGYARLQTQLIERKARWAGFDKQVAEAMFEGIRWSRLEVFRLLLARLSAMPNEHNVNRLDIYRSHKDGTTLLLHVVFLGQTLMVKELLEAGADPSSVFEVKVRGWTPLIYAASYDKKKMVEYLLDHGAEVNGFNLARETALYWTAMRGNEETAAVLLNAGADWTIESAEGRTVLSLAKSGGHNGIVQMIEDRIAKAGKRADGSSR
ncbi:hypothetical protein S7711_02941 [Stachybotrys chartarum IBT 7711]|uniref:Uncharacterized protein n=1 Tax=Stachybotrys chartarum (strain CBS 109288 / IBT 7711) TaxID=1280523 RepID=A0A084B2D4_STACB|nr:hypothetical protein S7711_02941 [Stachybotrys chartarum IBT 7711]